MRHLEQVGNPLQVLAFAVPLRPLPPVFLCPVLRLLETCPPSDSGNVRRLAERRVLIYGHKFGLELVRNYRIRLRSVRRVGPKPSEETLTSCEDGPLHVPLVRSALARSGGRLYWDDFPQQAGEVVLHIPGALSLSSPGVLEWLLPRLRNQ